MSGAIFGGDEVGAVVFDVGSYRTKVGIAGEDTPKGVFPTLVGCREVGGKSKDEAAMDTGDDDKGAHTEYALGTGRLTVPIEGRELRHPLSDGLVENWDLYEQLIEHAYSDSLRCGTEERPIIVVEPTWNTKAHREKMIELFFEKYNVPAFYLAKAPMLSSFANGRGTALVVDAGAEYTTVTPVYDGAALLSSARRTKIAGDFMTAQYTHLMEKRGIEVVPANMVASKAVVGESEAPVWKKKSSYPTVTTSYRKYLNDEVLRDLQVTVTRISEKRFHKPSLNNTPTSLYEFPNGYNCNWGLERYEIGEALFYPRDFDVAGAVAAGEAAQAAAAKSETKDAPEAGVAKPSPIKPQQWDGVQKLVSESIDSCDVDIHAPLWGNIVVCGALSLLPGYVERLSAEVNAIAPPGTRYKVISTPSSQERMFSSWLGGSIYGSLGTFQKMWISRKEYDEQNKSIVENRCP